MFDLAAYLTNGVENIVKGILRATLKDPKESTFMLKYSLASREASKRRAASEKNGQHIPPFLIASITSSCNLHCTGCYARHNQACCDAAPVDQLTSDEWLSIFRDARELGISFILLAGGEPMLREDIIRAAGSVPEILFPIFTNGTMIDEAYIRLFDQCRNLIPIFSIEGHQQKTDARRGAGVYQRLLSAMDRLQENHLIYGASITVTKENLSEVTSDDFVDDLRKRGCKAIVFVEYVPVSEDPQKLAPGDKERAYLKTQLHELRGKNEDMLFVSFPGDEKSSGGCLAAGRGFFHINSHGGAEPCPFSPYSDINVSDTSLQEALNSRLFTVLRGGDMLTGDHSGGCVLFEQRAQVETIMNREDNANEEH